MTNPAPGLPPFPIVGIGASAGGVEALQAFFEALPEPLGVAFVVVIHLSHEYRSELATLLARKTRIPVEEVSGTVALEADRVYVIPPDQRLQLTDTEVGAFPFEQPRGHRAPIDLFFRSLAEQYGDGFAVILSGSGSDGAVGVKAVKEQGGIILVQDPEATRFDGMPRAAIATGVADVVLPVRELAHRLAELIKSKQRIEQTLEAAERLKDDEEATNEELQTVNNELKTKLEEVSRAHNDLENLMAATEIGTLFLDRSLRIHRFTPPVTELFHIKSSDRNRSITDFTHRLNYDGLDTDAQNVLRDLAPIEREVRSQNGRWYLMRLRPYRTVDDRIDGVIITLVDITAHKQAEERLQQQAEQLREQDRYKNEFLGLLGHELRNPLAAISSVTELLRLDALPANEHRQAIELISDQVRHLRRLVDDLLNITRISRGQIALSKVPVNLVEVVAGAIDQVRPQIEARHHQLVRDLPEQPLAVEADPERLTQIVANLLSNAAQYTEEHGRITVTVGETEDRACLRVRDTGIGFTPDEARRLFEPFTRLKSPAGHRSAGLGLGLALASRLAELHGGRLEAASAGLGKGSEFTLWLPLLPEGQPLEPVQPSVDPDTGIPGRRILLVEDDETVGYAMVQVLRALGHEVQMVVRGGQAAQAVREFNPELVLLDIGLPDMGGYEVARQLRQEHGSEAFRLVALTGYAQELDWQQAEAAGFDRYLLKPAAVEELQAIIKGL